MLKKTGTTNWMPTNSPFMASVIIEMHQTKKIELKLHTLITP